MMYMPTTLPGLSVTKAAELMQMQDRIIRTFPEVLSVFGKAGRALTATDPAPTEMFETIIQLKPRDEWRPGVTMETLVIAGCGAEVPRRVERLDVPIRARIDMLATGIRTPVGVKVYGTDLSEMEAVARQVEAVLRNIPGTTSAYAERVIGGYYLDIVPDRKGWLATALSIRDAGSHRHGARRSEAITQTVEGRERYNVALRYPAALRQDPDAIAREVQGGPARWRHRALGRGGRRGSYTRRYINSHRKRPVGSLHLRRHRGPRPGRLCRRGTGSGGGRSHPAARLFAGLERAVRISGTGQGAACHRGADHAGFDLPAAVPELRRMTETLIVMLSLPFALVGGVWLMWRWDPTCRSRWPSVSSHWPGSPRKPEVSC